MSDVVIGIKRIQKNFGKPFSVDEVVEVPFATSTWYGGTFLPVHGRNIGQKCWADGRPEDMPADTKWIKMTVRSLQSAYDADIVFYRTSEGELKAFALWPTEEEPDGHWLQRVEDFLI